MTFTADMRLTIEIFDLIKSRGGKMTVYKDLALKEITKMREEDEQKYDLTSQMQSYLWDEGWNFAECNALADPIPMIVTPGYIAGAGMIHCWLEKPHEWCIPMEARLEDFHFAGYIPTPQSLGLASDLPTNTEIHMGFKKLYLYKVDKELGIKGLLERGVETRGQNMQLQAFGNQPGSQLQQLVNQQQAMMQQATGLSAPMLGAGVLGNSLGGVLSGNGKQASFNILDPNLYTGGPSAFKYIRRIYPWIKRVLTKTSGTDKSDNPKT